MRIAAKRLRYTLEICRGVWPGELDGIIKAVKAHQTLLGDIHDCDVWVDYLDGFKEAEYRRTVEFYGHAGHYHRLKGGIEYLQENRRQRRRELFEGLNDHWHRLDQDRLWTRLLGLIERVPESPDGAGSEGGGPETPSSGGDSATAAVKTTKTEPEIPLAEGDSSAEDPLASLAAGACSLDVPVEPSSEGEPGLFAGEQASSTGEGDAPPTGTGEEKAS